MTPRLRGSMLALAKEFIRAAGGYVTGDPCPECGGKVEQIGLDAKGPILRCGACGKALFRPSSTPAGE